MTKAEALTIAYTDVYMEWKLGKGHPTNPARAQLAVELLLDLDGRGKLPGGARVVTPCLDDLDQVWLNRLRIQEIHEARYAATVYRQGRSSEWAGERLDLAACAELMFHGTQMLVDEIQKTEYKPAVYFNPQGAKHHAMFDYSSGFCVFNDMAAAAKRFHAHGKRTMYLDWDVHHGDGVEALLGDEELALTASIHQGGIFPGTGYRDDPAKAIYNKSLMAGDGDKALIKAVTDMLRIGEEWKPDVLLLACGADGLSEDPLAGLEYSLAGIAEAARLTGEFAARHQIPVLIGGAGGYTPYDGTPKAWAATVATIQKAMAMRAGRSLVS